MARAVGRVLWSEEEFPASARRLALAGLIVPPLVSVSVSADGVGVALRAADEQGLLMESGEGPPGAWTCADDEALVGERVPLDAEDLELAREGAVWSVWRTLERRLLRGVTVDGGRVALDDATRMDWMALALRQSTAGCPMPVPWFDADGRPHVLGTPSDVLDTYAAVFDAGLALRASAFAAASAVRAAPDVSSLVLALASYLSEK